MTDKERQILEMQAPSTRACLERPRDLDLEWFNRELPKSAQVRDEHGEVFLNHRSLSYSETKTEESLRRARGGYLAELRNEAPAKSVSEQKRRVAIEAFMSLMTKSGIKTAFKAIMAGIEDVVETVRSGRQLYEK